MIIIQFEFSFPSSCRRKKKEKIRKNILLEYSLSGPFVSLFFLSSSSLPERKLDCQNINKLFEKVKKSPSKSLDAISFYPYTADIIKNGRHSSRRHTQQKWKRNKKEYHERRGAWTKEWEEKGKSWEKKINSKESSWRKATSRSRIINDSIIKLPFFRELYSTLSIPLPISSLHLSPLSNVVIFGSLIPQAAQGIPFNIPDYL